MNYYQAVDTFLKDQLDNPEKLPLYLYALPENQTLFKKIAKILIMIAQFQLLHLHKQPFKISAALVKK